MRQSSARACGRGCSSRASRIGCCGSSWRGRRWVEVGDGRECGWGCERVQSCRASYCPCRSLLLARQTVSEGGEWQGVQVGVRTGAEVQGLLAGQTVCACREWQGRGHGRGSSARPQGHAEWVVLLLCMSCACCGRTGVSGQPHLRAGLSAPARHHHSTPRQRAARDGPPCLLSCRPI